ncbi:DUF2613 family protein [Nocardioides sp.]|uniref:DUF2613 family protein n=1 Tax=Nocardioides sp. TaxID=35761 RepID=UPI002D02D68F|nr:DUF2613 family protein [Nocardioides sp.]HXH79149.1 DUF2613 family protein [Nocardioides sp.]
MNSNLIGPIASVLAGGVLAAVSVFGLISSQTAPPSTSPAIAEAPEFDYGTTAE